MPTLKNAVFHTEEAVQLPIFAGLDYLGGLEVEGSTVVRIHYARRSLTAAFNAYREIRRDIITRNGEQKDGDYSVSPAMPGWAGYLREYTALLEHEFEVPEVFTMDDVRGLKVREVELRKLGDLFAWPEPKPVKADIEPAKVAAA